MIRYEPMDRRHLPGVMRLAGAEDWRSYAKRPEAAWKALTAPGGITLVATEGRKVLGFAHMMGDGRVQAHLAAVVVGRRHRRRGIGRRLVTEAFKRLGGKWLNVITDDADDFYRSFAHEEWHGYRVYPQRKPRRRAKRKPRVSPDRAVL